MNNYNHFGSVVKAASQYNTEEKARKFALRTVGTTTDRREKRCIEKALADVPCGASVLDLPCGAGRLLPLLKKRGYKITEADISDAMLEQAQFYAGAQGENCLDETVSFRRANVFETGFEDNCFDAVVCHRLFQYFPESEVRRLALKELARICSGPIVVSFLCNFSVDAVVPYLLDVVRRGRRGCIPISYKSFSDDAQSAGLVVKRWIPMLPLLSKRWYAVLEKDTVNENSIERM
jgi:ubiquinone/menaquinone biosynthesis C-methylase UbiE